MNKDGSVCGKGHISPAALVYHTRTHTGDKPHICHEVNDNGIKCSIGFSQKVSLQNHINIKHKKLKDYVCKHILEDGSRKDEECGRCFGTKQNLGDHMQHHTGYRFVCKFFDDEGILCGNGCTSAANLENHVMWHHTDRNSPEYLKFSKNANQEVKERYANNVKYRVSVLMRSSFIRFMKKQGGKIVTTGRIQFLVGCSWEELVIHLHNNPYGYTLDMEGMDIDHIRCMVSFLLGDPIQQHRCMNFNNLQLMTKHQNRHVKRDTYIPAEYEQTDAYKAIELLVPSWVEMYKT